MQGANTEFNNLRAEIFHYNTQKWENLFSQGEKAGSCMWITQLTYDKHLSLFCQISKYVISYTGFFYRSRKRKNVEAFWYCSIKLKQLLFRASTWMTAI